MIDWLPRWFLYAHMQAFIYRNRCRPFAGTQSLLRIHSHVHRFAISVCLVPTSSFTSSLADSFFRVFGVPRPCTNSSFYRVGRRKNCFHKELILQMEWNSLFPLSLSSWFNSSLDSVFANWVWLWSFLLSHCFAHSFTARLWLWPG